MHLTKPLIAAATATALVVGFALPASADDTATTFTLTGGDLTLSVAPGAALTDAASGVETISGTLGTVSVTDARGGTTGWVTSAASTTFTGDPDAIPVGPVSVSTDVTYTNGTITESGTNTVAPATGGSIMTAVAVATASAVSGNNTASWNPTLDVSMPAGALAGDYVGTVTTSLA